MFPDKLLEFLLIGLVLTALGRAAHSQPCGDCDLSGYVDVRDALLAAQDGVDLVTVPAAGFPFCDVDSNRAITILDALRIAQVAVGVPVPLVCDDPPVASLTPLVAPLFGLVTLDFALADDENTPARVRLELSTDAGVSYAPLAASGGPMIGLAAPRGGAWHQRTWDTVSDLGAGAVDDLYLRVVPIDGLTLVTGAPAEIGPFDVSNLDVGAWESVAPAGALPAARYGAARASRDPDEVLIVGGTLGALRRTDTWQLDLGAPLPAFTDLAAVGLPGLAFAAAVADDAFDRVILHGGMLDTGMASDHLWVLDGPTRAWSDAPQSLVQPGARLGAVAALDALRRRAVFIGGHDGRSARGDVWTLALGAPTLGAWQLATTVGYPATAHAAIAHDVAGDRLLVFGGRRGGALANDVHAYDLASDQWSQVATAGTPPRPRAGAGAAFDPSTRRLLVGGGGDEAQSFADVFALDLSVVPARWRPIGLSTPMRLSPRQSAVWHLDDRGDLWVYGGTDPVTGVQSDLWRLDRR